MCYIQITHNKFIYNVLKSESNHLNIFPSEDNNHKIYVINNKENCTAEIYLQYIRSNFIIDIKLHKIVCQFVLENFKIFNLFK